jgi:ABC-2 type transport system ATP-binding protein
VISKGEIILVEDKRELMNKLGRKQLTLHLQGRLDSIPDELVGYRLDLSADGTELVCTFDVQNEGAGIAALLKRLSELGIGFKDLQTRQSSLEEIFVSLVRTRA